MVFDTVVEESITLESRFSVFACQRIDVKTRQSDESSCERIGDKYTGSTVSLDELVRSLKEGF